MRGRASGRTRRGRERRTRRGPPQIIGVRIEMSSSYAVCCMLHAVCCMLYAVLYAVCCILHAILKALGDATILGKVIKNLSNFGSKTDPKWGPSGFLGRPGALGRDHVFLG